MNAIRMLAALFFATLTIAAPVPQGLAAAASPGGDGGDIVPDDACGWNGICGGWKQ